MSSNTPFEFDVFQAAKFCAELRKQEGHQAWIVGIVEQGQRDAKVIDRPRIIEVITGDDGSVQVNFDFNLEQRGSSIFYPRFWKETYSQLLTVEFLLRITI